MTILLGMLFAMLMGIPAMLFHECGHIVMALLCGVKVKKEASPAPACIPSENPGRDGLTCAFPWRDHCSIWGWQLGCELRCPASPGSI